jgi:Bacterial Ig-like domain (group 3)
MEPTADGSPMGTPTTTTPVRTIPISVHVWLWIFFSVWVISFFLPAVSIMEQRPGRGWEVAWTALVLFFVPVKGMWFIFYPHVWLVWVNLFMLLAPFEIKRVGRGQGRFFAVLCLIATAIPIGIAYSPYPPDHSRDLVQRFLAGFYLWEFSLIATAGLFVRHLWQSRMATLPAVCLMGLLLALPVHRGEVDFLPAPWITQLEVSQAAPRPVVVITTRLIGSSLNPSLMGNPVTFTATVSETAGSTPTGTVYFSDGRILIGKANTTAGVSVFSTNALKTGEHFITANFSGDGRANYLDRASHGLIQMVNDPSDVETQTVLTVAERHQEQRADEVGFSVKARVTASGSTAPVTSGVVTFVFMYGYRTARKLDLEGEATLSNVLPVASWRGYQIEAIYSGGNGLQSSMSTLTLQ